MSAQSQCVRSKERRSCDSAQKEEACGSEEVDEGKLAYLFHLYASVSWKSVVKPRYRVIEQRFPAGTDYPGRLTFQLEIPAGLIRKTESSLAEKAGHLEMLRGGKKSKKEGLEKKDGTKK